MIAENPHQDQKDIFLRILKDIVQFYPLLVFSPDFLPKIKEWIEYSNHFELEVGKSLLSHFLAVQKLPHSVFNFVMIYFRKMMNTKTEKNRLLAIHGYIDMNNCTHYM